MEGNETKKKESERCFGRFYALGIKGHGFVYRYFDQYVTFGNGMIPPEDADLIVDDSPKGIMRKARRIVNRSCINKTFSDFRTWMENGLYIAVLEGMLTENGEEYGRFMVTNERGLMDFDD